MNCEKYDELLSAYADRETTPPETAEVEAHLQGCVSCREELSAVRRVKTLVSGLPLLPASPWLWTRIQSKIRKEEPIPLFTQISRGLAAAAAVVTFFLASVTLLGYFSSDEAAQVESSTYLGSHAYHLMRQPLANRTAWTMLAAKENSELLAGGD